MLGTLKDLIASLAAVFGCVHGDVGVSEQFVGGFLSGGTECNTHTGLDEQLIAIEKERGAHRVHDSVGYLNSPALIHILQENGEFVAAKAGHCIARPNTG